MITSNVARISLPLDATIVDFPAFGASEPVLNSANCTSDRHHAGDQRYDLRPCGYLG